MTRVELAGFVLGSPDPARLARFYRDLLGWTIKAEDPTWVALRSPDAARPTLAVQLETEHRPPTWPTVADHQQMQAHLDLRVDDLDAACRLAESLGAVRADVQPNIDGADGETVVVHLDPDGHPFCLFTTAAPD
ncbi:MAG: VOC family protein [Jatrophihabitans sp.]|uniref:VOC family protein n=1 Tax=Jatrophihabitans sp. TaxID=1932789 RepID=UPI003F81F274